MNVRSAVSLIVVAGIAGVTLTGGASAETALGRHPHLRHQVRERIMQRFDADKDGALSQSERQEARQARHARLTERRAQIRALIDSNNDGTISDDERQAARQKIQAFRAERRAEILHRCDANKDGQLDQQERQAARQELGHPLRHAPGHASGHGPRHGAGAR